MDGLPQTTHNHNCAPNNMERVVELFLTAFQGYPTDLLTFIVEDVIKCFCLNIGSERCIPPEFIAAKVKELRRNFKTREAKYVFRAALALIQYHAFFKDRMTVEEFSAKYSSMISGAPEDFAASLPEDNEYNQYIVKRTSDLCVFRNYVAAALQTMSTPKFKKEMLTFIATKLSRQKAYKTGSGQSKIASLRDLVVVTESGVPKEPRKPRSKLLLLGQAVGVRDLLLLGQAVNNNM